MISASLGKKHQAIVTKTWRGTFKQFVEALLKNVPTTEDKAAAGWVCGAEFKPEYRHGDNLLARHLLSLDYDHISEEDRARIIGSWQASGSAFLAYTTWSHVPGVPRIRVWVPLSRGVSAEEYQAISRAVAARTDINLAARESHAPSQFMYRPAKKAGGEFEHWENTTGAPLDAEKVLASYPNWTDRAAWPHRADEVVSPIREGGDPREKPGLVGDFCRAFPISVAIERFKLPYAYVAGDRWTYTAGSRPEGAIVYDDDTKLHSHHDTDPGAGQHNAWDLVRLHLFGTLDRDADDKPIATRPSQLAMVEMVRKLPEFVGKYDVEFEDLDAKGEEPPAAAVKKSCQKIYFESLAEILANQTAVSWLPGLDEILERRVQAVMSGPRSSYKSFIAGEWGLRTASEGATVVILSAEGAGLGRRIEAWLISNPKVPQDRLRVFALQRRVDLNSPEGRKMVSDAMVAQGIHPDLVIVDTYSKNNGGLDENSNSEIKAFVGNMARLITSTGTTILYVAHTGHAEHGRPRGGSALEADTDAAYVVKRTAPVGLCPVRVSRERFKDSPEQEPLEYEPQVVKLGRVDENGRDVDSLVLVQKPLSADVERVSLPEGDPGFEDPK
jgi:hypothetical protein